MKLAMLYANWKKFGEPWSTPQGIETEMLSRGHDVQIYNLYHNDGAFLPQKNVRTYSNDGLNRLINDFRQQIFVPDAILVMDYGPWDAHHFSKDVFPGVAILKECGDEPQSHRMHCQAVDRVHTMLSPDMPCVQRYQEAGYDAVYWTHHADTRVFYPRPEVVEEFDCVSTCGPRGNGLTNKIEKKLGKRFNNERYFYGEDHAIRLNMGKIVFQCSQHGEVTRRIFEGMACGKMVITDRLSEEVGLSTLFKEDEEIVFYDDANDAIEKIKYYADNDEERQRIALNGYNKVISEHSQASRCDVLEACVEKINDQQRITS